MFLPAIQPFELELDWLQAQAFRWTEPNKDGWYYGIVHDSLIRVRNAQDGIEFESDASDEALEPHVTHYFRLDQDISKVHGGLRQSDSTGTMDSLIKKYGGMRILRQDLWECLAAYICSQQNEVEGIAKIVNGLAKTYGSLRTLGGVPGRAFPTPRRLVSFGGNALMEVARGFDRGHRIHAVASDIADGRLDLNALARMPDAQARGVLMSYDGIGDKIADCVCLFGLDRPGVFPIDRHIGSRMSELYGQRYRGSGAHAGLRARAQTQFGEHAGYAGQLLFLDQLKKSNAKRS